MAGNIRVDQLPTNPSFDAADLIVNWDSQTNTTKKNSVSELTTVIKPIKSVNGIGPNYAIDTNGAITLSLSNLGASSASTHYPTTDKAKVNLISTTGDGDSFLANDGTYKYVSSTGTGSSGAGIIFNQNFECDKIFLSSGYKQNVEMFIYHSDFGDVTTMYLQAWLPETVGTTTISMADAQRGTSALPSYTFNNTDEDKLVVIPINTPAVDGLVSVLVETNVEVRFKKILIK